MKRGAHHAAWLLHGRTMESRRPESARVDSGPPTRRVSVIDQGDPGIGETGEAGLFRIAQMQRCVWAEMEDGALKLHGSHASSPENLAELVEIFEREGGRRPVERARAERAAAKARRAKK